MWPSRSKTTHVRSGERSPDIHVPSDVVKSMSRVFPRAWVTSHCTRPAPAFSPCGGPPWATSGAAEVIDPSINAALRVRGNRRGVRALIWGVLSRGELRRAAAQCNNVRRTRFAREPDLESDSSLTRSISSVGTIKSSLARVWLESDPNAAITELKRQKHDRIGRMGRIISQDEPLARGFVWRLDPANPGHPVMLWSFDYHGCQGMLGRRAFR